MTATTFGDPGDPIEATAGYLRTISAALDGPGAIDPEHREFLALTRATIGLLAQADKSLYGPAIRRKLFAAVEAIAAEYRLADDPEDN